MSQGSKTDNHNDNNTPAGKPGESVSSTESTEADVSVSAKDIRRFTSRLALQRTQGGLFEFVSESYTWVLGALTLITMAASTVVALRNSLGMGENSALTVSAVSGDFVPVSLMQAGSTLLITLAALLLALEMSLGPVSLTLGQITWWLPLPLSRQSFVRPGFFKSLLWPILAALAIIIPLSMGIVSSASNSDSAQLISVALSAVTAVALALTIYSLALWQQINGRKQWIQKACSFITVAAPMSLVLTVVIINNVPSPPTGSSGIPWLLFLPPSWPLLLTQGHFWPLVLVPLSAGLLIFLAFKLGKIPTARLRQAAVRGGAVAASILSVDSSALSASLSSDSDSRSSLGTLRWKFKRGSARSKGAKILLSTYFVDTLRQPRLVSKFLALAVLPAAVASIEFFGNAVFLSVVMLLCVVAASKLLGATARFANSNPASEQLVPLSAQDTRKIHFVAPALGMALYTALCFSILLLLGIGSPLLILLAVIAGLGLGGGTVRAAFRPEPDWTMPAIASPMGPIPAGTIRGFGRGPDLTFITFAPTLIALVVGSVPAPLLVVQLAISVGAFFWGTHVSDRNQR